MTRYRPAPDVETIANELIAEVPEHRSLAGARIRYVFRDKAAKHHGKTVWAKARKIGGLNAYLAAGDTVERTFVDQYDGMYDLFVLEVADDIWKMLEDNERRALIDHELCHFLLDLDGAYSIHPHDVEEFSAVLVRHGLWKSDVRHFAERIKPRLFDVDDTPANVTPLRPVD